MPMSHSYTSSSQRRQAKLLLTVTYFVKPKDLVEEVIPISKLTMTTLSHSKKVRSGRVSDTQITAMIDYMELNRSLVTGKFPGMNGRDALRQKWDDLSIHLNSIKGAQKTSAQWQVTWRDLKSRTSKKIKNIRNGQAATGNKAIVEEKITSLDERVVGLIGHTYIEGSDECPDSFPEEQQSIDRLVAGDDTVLDEPPNTLTIFSRAATPDAASIIQETSDAIDRNEECEISFSRKRAAAAQRLTSQIKRPCNRERLSTQLQRSKKEFVEISNKHANAMMTLAEAMKMHAEASLIAANAAQRQADAAVQQAANDASRIKVFEKLNDVLSQLLPQYV